MLPLILAGAALAALSMSKKSAATPALGTSKPSNYQPSQPSLSYPWRPIVPPRVDNANQPWAVGHVPASMSGGGSSSGVIGAANTLQAGASVVHSLSDVWGDMSDMFGGNDAKSNLVSADSLPSDTTSAPDYSSTADNHVGSVGDEYGSDANNYQFG